MCFIIPCPPLCSLAGVREGGGKGKRDLKPAIRILWKARGRRTAAGKPRACGWRKEAKVKPCTERRRESLRVPGEAPAARAAARAGCGPRCIPPPRPNPGTGRAGLFPLAGNWWAEVSLGMRRAGAGNRRLQLLWRPAPIRPPPRHSQPAPGRDGATGTAEGPGVGKTWNHHRFYLKKKHNKKQLFDNK